jgi:hypothetical protein
VSGIRLTWRSLDRARKPYLVIANGASLPNHAGGAGLLFQSANFVGRLTVLPFYRIRAYLETRNCVIGPYDLMIAGHARSRGSVVVTGNLGEFQRVQGLRSEDRLI